MDAIVARILECMERKGMDQKSLANEIGIRPQAITEWKKGVTASYTKYIAQIADVLDTSVEHLLTGEQKEKPAPLSESELDVELVKRLCCLTPDEMKQVNAFVQGLLAAR